MMHLRYQSAIFVPIAEHHLAPLGTVVRNQTVPTDIAQDSLMLGAMPPRCGDRPSTHIRSHNGDFCNPIAVSFGAADKSPPFLQRTNTNDERS